MEEDVERQRSELEQLKQSHAKQAEQFVEESEKNHKRTGKIC